MKILYLIVLFGLMFQVSAGPSCVIYRDVTYSNGTYTVKFVNDYPLSEYMIYDYPDVKLTKDNYYGYTCRHTDYLNGIGRIKIYVLGENINFACEYKVRTNKYVNFRGYATARVPGYGVIDCNIINRRISVPHRVDVYALKTLIHWFRVNYLLRSLA